MIICHKLITDYWFLNFISFYSDRFFEKKKMKNNLRRNYQQF